MKRVRISTTVDGRRLARSRELSGLPDSELLDLALAQLVESLEREREVSALAQHPYEDDPDLAEEVPPGPALPYDGDVPDDVLRLAARRRRERSA